jgi:type II secretory pathway predicted ATPase ExeA
MYLTNYNLRIKPFESSPDPRFIWLSEKHKEALDTLRYGIKENKGFLLLTGDIGTGKTTVTKRFLKENYTDASVALIPYPDLSIFDFFKMLSQAFNINSNFGSKGDFLILFENFLYNNYLKRKKVLLLIDEAQKLKNQLLEQIRLLSNIERQDEKLLNIFFVGQNDIFKLMMDEQNKALRQRITIHYNIEPLTISETRNYIKHRLRVAGSEEEIFSPDAIHEIFSFSKGYPRLINTICDRALLTGFVSNMKKINYKIIMDCADELTLLSKRDETRNADMRGVEVKVNQKTTFTRDPNADANLEGAKIDSASFEKKAHKFYNIKKFFRQANLKDNFISNHPPNKTIFLESGLNNYKSDKVNSNRTSNIKLVTQNLFMDLKTVIPSMTEENVSDLIEQVKAICKHQLGIEKIDRINFKHGAIVTHNGEVTFTLDFEISNNLSLLIDRKGKLINVYRSTAGAI